MPENTYVSLEEATLDQIVDELVARYRTIVVATLKPADGQGDTGLDEFFCDWRGGSFASIGMCDRVIERIHETLDAGEDDDAT